MASAPSAPKVLVAYDGSDASRRALERVAHFMKDADVAIVTVTPPIYRDPPYTGYADPTEEEQQRDILKQGGEALSGRGVSAEGYARVGDAAEEILAVATMVAAELIVIGARSLGRVERFVLGSVSTKVMHEAACDVLIVK